MLGKFRSINLFGRLKIYICTKEERNSQIVISSISEITTNKKIKKYKEELIKVISIGLVFNIGGKPYIKTRRLRLCALQLPSSISI